VKEENMKNKITTTAMGITSLAAMLLCVAPAVTMAQPAGRGAEGRGGRLAEYLGLSDEQKAAWQGLREEHKTEMAPLREEGKALHQRLRAAMDAATPDPTVVGSATLAMKQHRDTVRAAEKAFFGKLEGTLNDEQKAKLEAFKAARHHGGRRGFRGHGPAGGGKTSAAQTEG
jgi:Spy/CpxP family protein refolding chaperone